MHQRLSARNVPKNVSKLGLQKSELRHGRGAAYSAASISSMSFFSSALTSSLKVTPRAWARAETLAHADPRAAAFYCRLALETAVHWLYRRDATLKNPYDPTLAALLAEPSFQALIGRTLAVKARFVKDTGNAAAHGKPISVGQAAGALREFFHIAY